MTGEAVVAVKTSGPRRYLPALGMLAVVGGIAGIHACTSDQDYYANCVDSKTNQVVDSADCNDANHHIWMSTRAYSPGYRVPASARTGSGWFRADDTAARANAGLPETGSIPHGYKVSSSSGGFDGAHSSGGGGEGGEGGGHGSGGE